MEEHKLSECGTHQLWTWKLKRANDTAFRIWHLSAYMPGWFPPRQLISFALCSIVMIRNYARIGPRSGTYGYVYMIKFRRARGRHAAMVAVTML